MHHSELKRLIELSKKTGDTLIIAGSEKEESVVVMPLNRYEAILGSFKEKTVEVEEIEEDHSESVQEAREHQPTSVEPVRVPEQQTEVFETEPSIEEVPDKGQVERKKSSETEHVEKIDDFGGEEERFYLEPIE